MILNHVVIVKEELFVTTTNCVCVYLDRFCNTAFYLFLYVDEITQQQIYQADNLHR